VEISKQIREKKIGQNKVFSLSYLCGLCHSMKHLCWINWWTVCLDLFDEKSISYFYAHVLI